ncbi:DUF4232 domain-containing protein [Nocardia seriolae]|nr:DUF4232 domain-containing protein [Nocardia seriolae]MTJ63633.1 DUF4232 domain-containing protein [Nocardia seriolae]MTJ74319.1 DUF4232 domain-containing protein [Nocardia seriolae]MTJ88204.1 DUF4232 domain-containing protein [Nocardia seriolae]MTK32192.1 DUF4232 domain-containing protein [Nocardia seriolae]MTK41533.1 DUF4232 domain-containing protein [Nocardia seriolae]
MIAGLSVAAGAVACTSSPSTTSPPTGAPAAASAPTSTGSGGTESPAPASPTSSKTPDQTPAIAAPCGVGQVDVTAEVMSPATGHRGVEFIFSVSASGTSCTLNGYPGVDSGAGGPLLHADRTPRGYMGGLPPGSDQPPVVILGPGHPAAAIVEGVAFDNSGNGCPTYTTLLVTPPNSTDTRTVTAAIDTCALHIHPVTE